MEKKQKKTVGCEEWCKLAKLGLPAIKALWVNFEVHSLQDNRRTIVRCDAEVMDRRDVKSSSGVSEKRYVIKTLLEFCGAKWDIELTLTNRDSMGYRMLLGREAMNGRLMVDPSEHFINGDLTSEEIKKLYVKVKKPPTGLKIGVLASNPSLYSNERILAAGEERGHDMQFLNIKQCFMKLDADDPEIHNRGGKVIMGLDAVVSRIRPSITFYGAALTRHFESIGVYTLNSSQAITQSRDKLFSL
eukprot:COSAG01_NODE_71_length_28648_cov_1587.432449_23_plen_245_part_00